MKSIYEYTIKQILDARPRVCLVGKNTDYVYSIDSSEYEEKWEDTKFLPLRLEQNNNEISKNSILDNKRGWWAYNLDQMFTLESIDKLAIELYDFYTVKEERRSRLEYIDNEL